MTGWIKADCFLRVINSLPNILSKAAKIPMLQNGKTVFILSLSTIKGIRFFDVYLPERIIRKTPSFEHFCKTFKLQESDFKKCEYMNF